MNDGVTYRPVESHFNSSEVVMLQVLLSLMSYFQRTSMSIAGPSIGKQFALSETEALT